MTSRMRALGFTVASVALLGSAVAVACADEVKGPVHITSRGVENVKYYDTGPAGAERDQARAADRAARDAGRAQCDTERARAHEIAHAAREAARDIAQHRAEIARAAAEAVRAVSVDRVRIAREIAHAARDAAREISRHSRDIARAAREAVERAMNLQTVALDQDFDIADGIEHALLVSHEIQRAMGDPLESARSGIDRAEQGLTRQAELLDAMRNGDFSDVVVESDGMTKCGDPARHSDCAPLSVAEKADVLAAMEAGLAQARDGLAQARTGLAEAEQAMSGSNSP